MGATWPSKPHFKRNLAQLESIFGALATLKIKLSPARELNFHVFALRSVTTFRKAGLTCVFRSDYCRKPVVRTHFRAPLCSTAVRAQHAESPQEAQEAPKKCQMLLQEPPRGSKDCPRTSKNSPKIAQDPPGASPEVPKRPKRFPRRPEDTPRHMQTLLEFVPLLKILSWLKSPTQSKLPQNRKCEGPFPTVV